MAARAMKTGKIYIRGFSPANRLPFTRPNHHHLAYSTFPGHSLGSTAATPNTSIGISKEYLRASYSTTAKKAGPSSSSPRTPSSSQDAEMSYATGLIAKSGIELLTYGTCNGFKISIFLEELKAAYGLEYTWQSVDLLQNAQKQPWYTAVNPNGRVPAIVDHDRGGVRVFEGLAILNYLARTFDAEHRFSFDPAASPAELAEAESWMTWQHAGLGPMQGQANHFLNFPGPGGERDHYAIQRYVGEAERLYGVLEARLSESEGGSVREYVAGKGPVGRFSIADICMIGWVDVAVFTGVDLPALFPRVQAWLDRCRSRPAVQRGLAIPFATPLNNATLAAAVESDPERRAAQEEKRKLIQESKEKFGYKYSSP